MRRRPNMWRTAVWVFGRCGMPRHDDMRRELDANQTRPVSAMLTSFPLPESFLVQKKNHFLFSFRDKLSTESVNALMIPRSHCHCFDRKLVTPGLEAWLLRAPTFAGIHIIRIVITLLLLPQEVRSTSKKSHHRNPYSNDQPTRRVVILITKQGN